MCRRISTESVSDLPLEKQIMTGLFYQKGYLVVCQEEHCLSLKDQALDIARYKTLQMIDNCYKLLWSIQLLWFRPVLPKLDSTDFAIPDSRSTQVMYNWDNTWKIWRDCSEWQRGRFTELQVQCFSSTHVKYESFSVIEICPGLLILQISVKHSTENNPPK